MKESVVENLDPIPGGSSQADNVVPINRALSRSQSAEIDREIEAYKQLLREIDRRDELIDITEARQRGLNFRSEGPKLLVQVEGEFRDAKEYFRKSYRLRIQQLLEKKASLQSQFSAE